MENKEIVQKGIKSLLTAGAEKAQCLLSKTKKYELNVENGKFSLLRTTSNNNLSFKTIKGSKQGISRSNKIDKESINNLIKEVIEIAEASEIDSAYDISEKQESEIFTRGIEKPDLNKMYDRLNDFLKVINEKYPDTILESAILDFTRSEAFLMNSNGIDFTITKGFYNFGVMFTSKKEKKTSSFNYTGYSMRNLNKELMEGGSVERLIKQSEEQISLQPLKGKFIGDIIITPECLNDFIYFLTGITLYDGSLISETSLFKNKLNQQVANSIFTLHSKPVSNEIINNYFVTNDGYKAFNNTIINKGILKSFLLSQYGAKKTGKDRAINSGGAYVVEPGNTSFKKMVQSIKEGLLLCRFSGGMPSNNGDFSGVAKNSYYIKDGEIQYPVNEVMVSGNLFDLFMNINAISSERIDDGNSILPWIKSTGFTISGK